MIEKEDLLKRIDAAIAHLLAIEPQTDTLQRSIANLRHKRALVESDAYVMRQVNEEAVALVGRMICNTVKFFWRPSRP